MDYFLRETLSRERMASLVAEADRDRLARMCRAERSEPRVPWHRRLLAPLGGRVAAAAHRAVDVAGAEFRAADPSAPGGVKITRA